MSFTQKRKFSFICPNGNWTLAKKQNSIVKSRFWTCPNRFGQIQNNLYQSQTICTSTKQFWPFQNRFGPTEGQRIDFIFRRLASWIILRSLFWVYDNEIKLWIFISKSSWIESPVVFEFYFETVRSFRELSRLCLLWKGIQKLRIFIIYW